MQSGWTRKGWRDGPGRRQGCGGHRSCVRDWPRGRWPACTRRGTGRGHRHPVGEAGLEAADEIKQRDGQAQYWQLDTTDEQAIQRVFAEAADAFGRLDVLVNNAGIAGANKPTHEMTEAEWDRVQAVNVKGVFFCTKHAIPCMLRGRRRQHHQPVLDLRAGRRADAPPYHASKGAVRLMSKTDALLYARGRDPRELDPPRLHLDADGGERLPAGAGRRRRGTRRALDALHPLGHMGEPDDIAWGIVYLASDEAKFVTGSELVIDGGYTAR